MFRLIKTEWKKVFLPVLLVTVIMAVVASVLSCTLYQNYALHYDLEAWEIGTEFFGLLYPLFAVIPLCWSLFYEKKNNFLLYVVPRISIRKYMAVKWLVYAWGSFTIIAFPYILSAIIALYVKAPVVPFDPGMPESPFAHVFLDTFIQRPMLYAVVLSCWKGLIGILVMTMGFVLALYCKNIFIVLTAPFMYSVLESFILAILSIPEYRLVTAFEPTCVSSEAVSVLSFVVGPVLLMAATALLACFYARLKKMRIVEA
ncbi:MAG: hypothetical protein HFH87_00875 [Lachnospiraceae bacterium]|nr:hypothetical protein [Lachnospiraceae bacterium]